jgi:uncharacterized protein (DUF488 family)
MLIQTLGYAQWTLAEVAAHVRKADALLVDVRRQPYSSKSGFRKPDLQDELDDRYLHVPAFGNENFQHPDAPIEIRNVWRGIHRLQERAVPETIVLLCGCADPQSCHRTVVAETLADVFQADIRHLSPPDNPRQGALFDD